jgi:hypothetical protein
MAGSKTINTKIRICFLMILLLYAELADSNKRFRASVEISIEEYE